MAEPFKAIQISKPASDPKQTVALVEMTEDELMEGDVTVAVEYSTINYKDGLALTGKAPVVRRYPMIPGIDLAGHVLTSRSMRFSAGDRVILNGFGLGETHFGGLAQRARVKADWLLALPASLTTKQAMGIGTAGYTAALCVIALERNDVSPGSGDVLVTGAAGGVGSIAISLLKRRGFRVIASSRRAATESDYLKTIGAADIIDARELTEPGRALGKERWIAAIDSVGSHTLVNVLAGTRYGGTVAACGLAQGSDLQGTVMPFILRNVTLAGIDSVMTPRSKREAAWNMLAKTLDLDDLERITTSIGLSDVVQSASEILAGNVRGRVVVSL